jgi:ribosomal protein S13
LLKLIKLVFTKLIKKSNYKNNINVFSKNTDLILSDIKFNNLTLTYNQKLNSFIEKHYFGINKYSITKIAERVEINKNYLFDNYNIDRWLILSTFLSKLVPNNKSIKDKIVLNLNFLYLIRSYRGWRHTFNLPVRGQRTWSNAWTLSKSKNYLREYKYNCFKKGLNYSTNEDIKNAFYLEQLNALWKWQWEKEWLLAFKKRQAQLKKTRGLKRLELSSLSKVNPNFTKSKKQVIIPIGFENGFMKNYLKNSKKTFNNFKK